MPETIDVNYKLQFGGTQNLAPALPIIKQYGLMDVPIWDTEGSWGEDALVPSSAGCGRGVPLSDVQKAMYVARNLLLNWSNKVTRFYWYAYTTVGTLNDDSPPTRESVNAAGVAYMQMQKLMTGAFMLRPCTASGKVWSCMLTRNAPDSYAAVVVWDFGTNGYNGSSSYRVPSGYTSYCDVVGRYHGKIGDTVIISGSPLMLRIGEVCMLTRVVIPHDRRRQGLW